MKKKKLSKLAQHKANPNSKYWRDKADDAWAKEIREVGACEICSGTGKLDSHHIISRTRLRHRHDLSNGVCLCIRCHRFDSYISPHADSFGGENFLAWLKRERYGQWQWYEEAKEDKRVPDKTYKQYYEELI